LFFSSAFLAIEKTKLFATTAVEGLAADQSDTLPKLSASSGFKVIESTPLVFKKSSSQTYPEACIDGSPVTFIASKDDGTAQVQWKGGFMYVDRLRKIEKREINETWRYQ
jgi:hypothetical protein